jgi:putative peptidoglycan lipid II flippase
LLRVFYAMHDSRTPALIGAVTMVVNITANLIAIRVLPAADVVAGLGIGFGISNLVGAIAGWWTLSRRIGGLDGNRIGISLVKMHLSAVPCVLLAAAVSVMVGSVVPAGTLSALITVILAGSGALLFYVLFAKAFGITELTDLSSTLGARLRR